MVRKRWCEFTNSIVLQTFPAQCARPEILYRSWLGDRSLFGIAMRERIWNNFDLLKRFSKYDLIHKRLGIRNTFTLLCEQLHSQMNDWQWVPTNASQRQLFKSKRILGSGIPYPAVRYDHTFTSISEEIVCCEMEIMTVNVWVTSSANL